MPHYPPPEVIPSPAPAIPPAAAPAPVGPSSSIPSTGIAKLTQEQITQVQKYCKFASSATDYNDLEGTALYLEKALRLLRTGKDN